MNEFSNNIIEEIVKLNTRFIKFHSQNIPTKNN